MNAGPSNAPGDAVNVGAVKTTLGPVLSRQGGHWHLDLTRLPIFRGLSVLARALGDMVIDSARGDRVDVHVERDIRPRENPELRRHLGVARVKLAAERDTAVTLLGDPELFQDRLRALFGTLQRRRYRETLFPPAGEGEAATAVAGTALLFRFTFPAATVEGGQPRAPHEYVFLLEPVASPDDPTERRLRITIEDAARPRLALGAIRHRVVEDVADRTFIAGSTRIAETWAEGLRREAERNRRTFVERRKPYSHLFRQFGLAGLGEIEEVSLSWTDAFVDRILESDPAELAHVLKRVLLGLEDGAVRDRLRRRELVRVVCADVSVDLDQSHLGRVLNLAIGGPRERTDLDAFLERMPATLQVAAAAGEQPLAGVRIFLVHHITAEVLGLIAALRRLGCRDLTTLFVAYGAEAPAGYLGPLLELPPDEFRCLALANVPDEASVEGHYRLSSQYSALDGAAALDTLLAERRLRFFEAMRAVVASEFLRQARRAEAAGDRLLILEDGGYLAPAVNRACLEDASVGAFLVAATAAAGDADDAAAADPRPFADLLAGRLIGSVEHTRNGMNRLAAVEAAHDRLAFPALTIAVSRRKIEVEAREVAVTILNAVENVLHAAGRVLSRRHCLVLGSRGAIGGHLVSALGARLLDPAAQLAGVDLCADGAAAGVCAAKQLRGLSAGRWHATDLVLGVTGESVLTGEDLETWLAEGTAAELVLASGSTKTVEFADLAAWVDARLAASRPSVGGRPVEIEVREVTDAVAHRVHGQRYSFTFLPADEDAAGAGGSPRRRDVVFLANLTPVNFMFYGVPTEVIDEVLAELLAAGLELAGARDGEAPAPGLHLVDPVD